MDEQVKRQISKIVEHETDIAFRKVHDVNQQLIAKHAAQGTLQSGAMVKIGLRTADEVAGELLDALIEKVGKLPRSEASLAHLKAGFDAFLDRLESEEVKYLAKLASGNASRAPEPAIWDAARKLFQTTRDDLERKIEIAAFDFREQPEQASQHADVPKRDQTSRNKGGKPLAAHWDGLWAEIATKLWNGDLEPQSQADIKRAMFDWLNDQGIDAGDTAVTARARALWDRMQSDN